MAERIIAVAVQSVPDIKLNRRANIFGADRDDSLGAPVAPAPFERLFRTIVCIAVVLASRVGSEWKVDAIDVSHVGRETEKDIVLGFLRRLRRPNTALVTFGGVDFVLPLIRWRAMTNQLGVAGPSESAYFDDNSSMVMDLSKLFRFPGTNVCATLEQIGFLLGLDRSKKPLDATEVERFFRMHRVREIAAFEQRSAIDLYRIWLRHQLFIGALNMQSMLASEKHLDRFVATRDDECEAFGLGHETSLAEDVSIEEPIPLKQAVA